MFQTKVFIALGSNIGDKISNIKQSIHEIKKYGMKSPMVGHVGDGNFHTTIMYDPMNNKDYDLIRNFSDKLIEKALQLDGTITGEHGVGMHKKEYLKKQHADNIPVMKLIKRSIDQNNIMNPGKIFDLNWEKFYEKDFNYKKINQR